MGRGNSSIWPSLKPILHSVAAKIFWHFVFLGERGRKARQYGPFPRNGRPVSAATVDVEYVEPGRWRVCCGYTTCGHVLLFEVPGKVPKSFRQSFCRAVREEALELFARAPCPHCPLFEGEEV